MHVSDTVQKAYFLSFFFKKRKKEKREEKELYFLRRPGGQLFKHRVVSSVDLGTYNPQSK